MISKACAAMKNEPPADITPTVIEEMKPSYSMKEAPTRSSSFVSGCLAFQKTMGRLRDQSLTLAEVGKWILVNTTLRICARENFLCP